MIQWNIIGVPLICAWNNLLGNISESLLMLLKSRCLWSSTYFASPLLPQLLNLIVNTFIRFYFCPVHIHEWGHWRSFPWVLHYKGPIFDQVFHLLQGFFKPILLTSTVNLVNFEKLLGSGIKWNTSDTDSSKAYNEFFNYFTTKLKTLCKTLPIIFDESSTLFN